MSKDLKAIEKSHTFLKGWLYGRKWFNAARSLTFAESYHSGMRKDGVTPEFAHQTSIVQFIRPAVAELLYPEETLSAAFLHDVMEDYDVSADAVLKACGSELALNAVNAMNKRLYQKPLDPRVYFHNIAHDPIASVVKGADRINNVQTMVGVFSLEKQREYLSEVTEYFLPMIKTARSIYPSQEAVYEMIKHMLISQTNLISAMHNALEVKNGQ